MFYAIAIVIHIKIIKSWIFKINKNLKTLYKDLNELLADNIKKTLDEAIKFIIKNGAKSENIKVAGQSFTETPIEAMAKKSQLLSVCLENKVDFVDLGKGTFKRIEKNGLVC